MPNKRQRGGANFIHHAAGMIDDMSTIAYEQFVIDNDMLGMALRAVRGIEVNEDTLALDIIDQVGPGGHYLLEDHTIGYMRSEHYFPSAVFNHQGRDDWALARSTNAWDRAKDIVQRILAEHKPQPIDHAADPWIRERFSL